MYIFDLPTAVEVRRLSYWLMLSGSTQLKEEDWNRKEEEWMAFCRPRRLQCCVVAFAVPQVLLSFLADLRDFVTRYK